MFHEYALEPAVLSNWERVRYFLDAFAPWKGRFIASYPKHWRRLVHESLRCPDVEKKQIEVKLAALDRRVFADRKGAPFDSSMSWADNALAENRRETFRAVIVADSIVRGGNVLNANTLDETDPLWRVEQGRFVARDSAALHDAIRLLLRLSTRIALIDPYFRPHQRNKASAFAALSSTLSPASKLEVHARWASRATLHMNGSRSSASYICLVGCMRAGTALCTPGHNVRVVSACTTAT